MQLAKALHAGIPRRGENTSFTGEADGAICNRKLRADFIVRDAIGDRMSRGLVQHGSVLPYSMARGKPYDCPVSHFLWHDILEGMTDTPYADIAARIKWHRAIEGLNQSEYARRAGVKRSQLSNWETGLQRISIDGAMALRRTYGLSLDFIYEGIDDALPMTLRKELLDNPRVSASK